MLMPHVYCLLCYDLGGGGIWKIIAKKVNPLPPKILYENSIPSINYDMLIKLHIISEIPNKSSTFKLKLLPHPQRWWENEVHPS